jgi:hypothetical protein
MSIPTASALLNQATNFNNHFQKNSYYFISLNFKIQIGWIFKSLLRMQKEISARGDVRLSRDHFQGEPMIG